MDPVANAPNRPALDRAYADAVASVDPSDVHALAALRASWRDRAAELETRPSRAGGTQTTPAPGDASITRPPRRAAPTARRSRREKSDGGSKWPVWVLIAVVLAGVRACRRFADDDTSPNRIIGIGGEPDVETVPLRSLVMPYAKDEPPPTTRSELQLANVRLRTATMLSSLWDLNQRIKGYVQHDEAMDSALEVYRDLAPLIRSYERRGRLALEPADAGHGTTTLDVGEMEKRVQEVIEQLDTIEVAAKGTRGP